MSRVSKHKRIVSSNNRPQPAETIGARMFSQILMAEDMKRRAMYNDELADLYRTRCNRHLHQACKEWHRAWRIKRFQRIAKWGRWPLRIYE